MAQARGFTESFDLYPATIGQVGYGLLSTWVNVNRLHETAMVAGRFGGQALRGASSATGWRSIPPTTQVVAGCAFRFTGAFNHASQQPITFLSSNGNEQIRVGVTANGSIRILRGATVLAESEPNIITQNAWAYIEFAVTLSDTTGTTQVWLNDFEVPELTLTGVDTKNHATDTDIGRVQICLADISSLIDDMYCDYDGITRTGEGRIYTRPVSGDDVVEFSRTAGAANFEAIDEVPANGTDYTYSSVLGDRDIFHVSDMEYTPATIFGVQLVMLAQKDDAGARALTPFLSSGGIEVQGAQFPLTLSSWIFSRTWYPTDPDGGGAWTKDAIDALKAGYEVTV